MKKVKPKYIPKVGDWVRDNETGHVGQIVAIKGGCSPDTFILWHGDLDTTRNYNDDFTTALPRIDRTGDKLKIVHPNPYAKWGDVEFENYSHNIMVTVVINGGWGSIFRYYSKRSNAIRGLIRLSLSTGMSFEVEG